MTRAAVFLALLLLPDWLGAQIILSRRVYTGNGRSWQQLWISPTGYDNFKQLTRTTRNHDAAVCSRDGKRIFFTSDDPGDFNVAFAYSQDSLWSFDRITGEEQMLRKSPADSLLVLMGVTADGAPVVNESGNLIKIGRTGWRINKADAAALSPDGTRLAITQEGGHAFITDGATGKTRLPIGRCQEAVWSPDGRKIACINGADAVILDAMTRKETRRIRFHERESALEAPVWSPDETRLLVGTYGENGGSGDPQLDYFLLDPAATTWTRAMTGQQILWLPGSETVLYIKPVNLSPLPPAGKHSVWTTQLARYDLATHKDTSLTSGLMNNISLGFCGK